MTNSTVRICKDCLVMFSGFVSGNQHIQHWYFPLGLRSGQVYIRLLSLLAVLVANLFNHGRPKPQTDSWLLGAQDVGHSGGPFPDASFPFCFLIRVFFWLFLVHGCCFGMCVFHRVPLFLTVILLPCGGTGGMPRLSSMFWHKGR